ncbi:translation initiation factor IF-2-like [Pteropus medius]|uniref:translation initiation factor IF-2-like n=1 Tax=Pteropus vampyrus TaxID=132908 RepID=UPI00196B1EB9|nr:translation initiation factor IF-2-like [Pteropus giganteus]
MPEAGHIRCHNQQEGVLPGNTTGVFSLKREAVAGEHVVKHKEYINPGVYFYSGAKVLRIPHTAKGGKHTRGRGSIPETRSTGDPAARSKDPGARLRVTCQDAPAANWRARPFLRPCAHHVRRTDTSATSDADARDQTKNKKTGPASLRTGLRRGRESSHVPRRRGLEPRGAGRPGGKGSGSRRCGVRPEPTRREGCKPSGVSGDPARSPWARTPGRGGTRGGKAAKAQGGDSARRGTRATHSPPAAAPAASRRCKPASEASRPRSRRREPLAPARSAPRAPHSIRCRRVSGLRSGESPPPGSAGGAGRRWRRKREEERPGPRPDAGHTVRAPWSAAAPRREPGNQCSAPSPPPGRRPSSAKATGRSFEARLREQS